MKRNRCLITEKKESLTRLRISISAITIYIFKEGRTQHKWDEGIENFSKGTASFDYYYTLIKLSLNTKQGAMLIATCCSLIFNELSALGYIKYTLITYNNHFAGAITANKKIILKDVPNTRFAYNLYIH